MTNANRARRNSGKKAASAQSVSASKTKPGETREEELFLRVFSDDGDSVYTVIHELLLPPDLANYMRASASPKNVNLSNFIVQSLRNEIQRDELGFSVPALEDAIQKTLVALDSMDNKLLTTFEEKMRFGSAEYDPQLTTTICAFHMMALGAAKDLHKQYERVLAYIQADNSAS